MTLSSSLLGLTGGALIGLSSAALLALNGRIAGISGIFGGVLAPTKGDTYWRVLFIAGLLVGGALMMALRPTAFPSLDGLKLWPFAIAGILVGFGTRMGGGCTSGHGVCGMGRLSKRSMVATPTFIATGVLTVYVAHHLVGIYQ